MNETCFRLDIQYHGARFHGWQRQPNAPSVEATLSQAYERFLRIPVYVDASGRTDAGVHARHQVVLLRARTRVPPKGILFGIKPHLPEGLSIFQVTVVPESWRPRPAITRQYRYFLWKESPPPLFYQPFTAWDPHPLDVDLMGAAAEQFLGERDFSTLRGAGCTARHAIRRIDRIMVLNRGPYWEFRVTGNAFLRQMVRILVGTLVEVGNGHIPPADIQVILDKKDRSLAGPTFPPQGLFLWRITLPDEPTLAIPPTCWEIPMR